MFGGGKHWRISGDLPNCINDVMKKVNKQEFANVVLTKSLILIRNSPKFSPPNICAKWYIMLSYSINPPHKDYDRIKFIMN